MRVGVVREVKSGERRVALTPAGASELVSDGHEVLVESGAGAGARHDDGAYAAAGASLIGRAADVWQRAELLLKVKEPIAAEYALLHDELVLFTYLHLAAEPELTEALARSGCTAIGYETVRAPDGSLPLLRPMSEIAGRLATQAAAYFLQAPLGGPGLLLGGSPGVMPARVTVVGGGAVGFQAAQIAVGMRADVTILERSPDRMRELDEHFGAAARVAMSSRGALEGALATSDVVIGAVLVPGARAPRLVSRGMLTAMRPGSLLVDVAIDQGGCFETSRPTTHEDPVYELDDVSHYCVANMPGAVPVTSTQALTDATLPYVLRLTRSVDDALSADPGLAAGVNVRSGAVVLGVP